MRLIDADKLQDKDINGSAVNIFDVLEAETIEAIPIEWINKRRFELGRQINKECFVPNIWTDEHFIFMVDKQIAYTQIIEEWRKEKCQRKD